MFCFGSCLAHNRHTVQGSKLLFAAGMYMRYIGRVGKAGGNVERGKGERVTTVGERS